jgi:hypothetical protein
VLFENGDFCNIGTMEKNSPRIKKSAFIEYIIDEKSKTKVVSSSNDAKKLLEAAKTSKKQKEEKFATIIQAEKQRIKGQEAFLGYSWSYAKDLLIAGKTSKDMEELNAMARYIYDQIGKMLINE